MTILIVAQIGGALMFQKEDGAAAKNFVELIIKIV